MSYGRNLSAILGMLQIRYKDAADKIGISYNTLSNIQNDKFEPSEKTKKKILEFLSFYGFSEADVLKNDRIFQNIRIRSSKALSGIEKAQFRADFQSFLNILKKSDSHKESWLDYFEYCNRPTDVYEQETLWDRREMLRKKIAEKDRDIFLIVFECFQTFSNGRPMPDSFSPVNIIYFLDSLGIRRFFMPFKTEKIASFSTSFSTDYTTPYSYCENDPVIVINTKVCSTVEKCLIQMAKELFFMLASPDEYSFMNEKNIQIIEKAAEDHATDFAENILIRKDELELFLQKNKHFFPAVSPVDKNQSSLFFKQYDFSYVINEIKREFHVGYELAIKKLFETNFEYLVYFENSEQAVDFYFQCLKRHDEEYQDTIVYLNGEPEPLPLSFRGYDSTRLPLIDERL